MGVPVFRDGGDQHRTEGAPAAASKSLDTLAAGPISFCAFSR